MIATSVLLRASAGKSVGRLGSSWAASARTLSWRPALHKQAALPTSAAAVFSSRAFANSAIQNARPAAGSGSTAAATAGTRGPKAGGRPKKAASPKKAATPRKKVEKLKSWQARGEDGKLLPLPSASKPKKQSAFLIYVQARTPELRNDSSLLSKGKDGADKFDVTKMSKQLGAEWRSMSDADKKQFFDTAEKQKASYEAAMEEWRESLTPQDIRRQNAYIAAQRKKGIKGTAMLRDPAKPKAPKTPFFSFMSDLRSKDPSGGAAAVVDFARKAGEQWKNMTADEKKPFEARSANEREQYARELAKYKSQADA